MTHADLVKEAKKWLISAKSCNPVFCEKGSNGCTEIPDAIGWTCDDCIVVEVKVSKADFMANRNKSLALGTRRYFMVPKDLVNDVEPSLPEGYGLIAADKNMDDMFYVRQVRFKDSAKFESNKQHEVRYLRSRILDVQRYGL